MKLHFPTILLLMFGGEISFGQVCSWKPSRAPTLHVVAGKPAHFYFESLTPSWNGNLFTWKLDGARLAVHEYRSEPTPRFVADYILSSGVIASSKYVSNTKSEHNLTITSLLSSDDGKQMILQREGCSSATEKAKPITLSVSCCDSDVFGNDATLSARGSSIGCLDEVVFLCNEAMYQATYFTAVCQTDSTWNIKKHTCVPKSHDGVGIALIVIGSMLLLFWLVNPVMIFKKKLSKMKNECDMGERNESQPLVLEDRVAVLDAEGKYSRLVESILKFLEEQHKAGKTESSLLLMAECYVHLVKEDKAERAIAELKELSSRGQEVLDSADDLIKDNFYLRAIILLRISSDKYKSDTLLHPDEIVDGIYKCIRKIVGVVKKTTSVRDTSCKVVYRCSRKYIQKMAADLRAVADADPKIKAEYYKSSIKEIELIPSACGSNDETAPTYHTVLISQ